MAIEATIVEQLQELQKWQTQRKEELIKQQQKQREQLSNEQNRIYHSLSLSVEEMNLNDQSLKELIGQEQEETIADLIDFNTPDEQCESQRNDNFTNYVTLTNEKNNNKKLNLKEPQVQLNVKNTNFNLESNLECNHSCNPDSYNSQFSTDSIQSFSSRLSDRQHILLDEIPVPSPKKDFNTLLEERLKDDEAANVKNKNKPILKRPFLKKGQGLARFMPNSNSNEILKGNGRPRSVSFSTNAQSNNNKPSRAAKLERCNSLPRSKQADASKRFTTNPVLNFQPKLTMKNMPPPKKKTRSKSISSMLNSIVEKKNPVEIISDTNSSDLESKNKRELDEVRIFEFLEDKAENSSFCSTSSTVIAFLQQSTPLKHKALLHSASKHKISLNDVGDKTLENNASKASQVEISQFRENIKDQKHLHWDKVPISKMKGDKTVTGTVLPYGTDIDEHYEDYVVNQELSEDENSVSLHVRFSEHNEYKTMTDASSVSSDSETITNYINNKEAWSDCSDSSDMESIISLQLKTDDDCNDNKKISPNFIKHTEDNSDEDEIEFKSEMENEEENENEIEERNLTLQNDDTVIDEKNENTSLFKSQLLKTRLLELEQEIEIFRKESAALTFQKQKLQEERTKLHDEHTNALRLMKEKEETLEMEKRKTETILQEEKKRLTREKLALENRMKDAWEKAQKSKQERQEIQTLKDQLEDLKDEYDQKESKWSATNARQRSQIRVLQTENSKLKQELEKIQQKKNAKFKKPTTTSNTRAINQINKLLGDRKKEVSKMSNNNDVNHGVGSEVVEEKQQEKKIEKVKILKTAESIARTRNLYESLLRDATENFTEIKIGKRNLIDKCMRSDKKKEDYLNYEENDYNCDLIEDSAYPVNAASPTLLQETEESNKHNDERNNKAEQVKFADNKQGIREVHHPDGHIEYWYPNGNVKKVFPDKFLTKIIYYNGDVSETDKNGTVKYFYASLRTWHTTMQDGLEILEFPDGQVERKSKNGTIEVSFPDGSVKIVQTDGSEKWALQDGTIAETSADGEKILILPNGQREIHTKEHKRREYLDGTVKLIYPNGIQETRYANGRIRLKDKDGNLIMDSH